MHGPVTPTEPTQWRGRAFDPLHGPASDHRDYWRECTVKRQSVIGLGPAASSDKTHEKGSKRLPKNIAPQIEIFFLPRVVERSMLARKTCLLRVEPEFDGSCGVGLPTMSAVRGRADEGRMG